MTSASLPIAGNTYGQERLGIAAVQLYAANHQQIWRETNTGDVGIDGHIEFVTKDGFATGRLVAAQVKAGPSYFSHPSTNGWKFYPSSKHRQYWEAFPLPVLLILHDPESKRSYWTDARQVLRTPGEERAYIEVSSNNVLESADPVALFENAGVQEQNFIGDISVVLKTLIEKTSRSSSFPLGYFDLFVHGLTNIARSIYYGTDVIMNAAEYNLHANESPNGVEIGEDQHKFAFGFVQFLLAHDLAQIDYSDCLIDWVDRQMQPQFVAPLTSRGRALVGLIHAEERRLVESGKLPDAGGFHVAQEGCFQMVPQSYLERFPRIYSFQNIMAAELTE